MEETDVMNMEENNTKYQNTLIINVLRNILQMTVAFIQKISEISHRN